ARIDRESLDALFDPRDQLVHVDAIFQRLGLLDSAGNAPTPHLEAVTL
ncbi:MAG: hypothetical protein IT336_02385, partial [Thermomicrobiales bacterium]|nr:hypothetical protein [Thermomicrobiales bacterium]